MREARRTHMLTNDKGSRFLPHARERHAAVPCRKRIEARLLMSVMMRQQFPRRQALAEIMNRVRTSAVSLAAALTIAIV